MATTTNVDLRELAVERAPRGERARRRYPWISRRLVPAAIAIGFLALIGWAARDRFRRPTPVKVMPIFAQHGAVPSAASGAPLFQAAGWVEPRPRPVFAAALTMGVVEEVLVVEGQDVKRGDPIARLIDVDARLALQQAKATTKLREAEVASATASRKAAETRLDRPVHLDAALAEAESLLAEIEAEINAMPFQVEAALARLEFARNNLEGKISAAGAISTRLRQQAQSAFDEAQADCQEMQGRLERLTKQREALERRREALATQRELLIDEKLAVADAIAQENAARAQFDHSELDRQVAELALERTLIISPIDGRVLEVLTQPGTRLSGLATEAPMGSAAVASLYDPNMLQVRADVRLDDVRSVSPGQAVKIETPASPAPIEGIVLSATSQANIGKNTLEVKVAIDEPPPLLRPEMLVTATFLAPREREATAQVALPRVLIPRRLVIESNDEQAVWVAAAGNVARRKIVRLGGEFEGGLVEVVDGLATGDWLIASNVGELVDEAPIEVQGEAAAESHH